MKHSILISLATFFILYGCATRQDAIILNDRLLELEYQFSQMENLTKSQKKEGRNIRSQSAGLRVRLDEINEELQILRGKIEETEFLLKQKTKASEDSNKKEQDRLDRLKEIATSNRESIIRIEKYLNLEISVSDHTKKTGLKTLSAGQPGKKLTENELYLFAKQAFDEGNLETAREKFQEFIDRYPKSENADNAQFWIGEVFYREKWYEKAILEYQKVIEKYPKGNKVPASLLKQGFAFYNLKDKANSRLILKELIRKYPDSNEAKIAKKKLKEF